MTVPAVWLQDPDVTLWHGDCLEVLRQLPDRSVHMVATSPPFYGLRDYGTGTWEGGDPDCDHLKAMGGTGRPSAGANLGNSDGRMPMGRECGRCGARRVDRQIGLEETPDEWVARLVAVFREVRRVLRDDGTLWVEIGDSYNAPGSSGYAYGDLGGLSGAKSAKYQETQKAGAGTKATKRVPGPYKVKDLLGQPWLLAKALRDPYYTGKIKPEADRVWLAAMLDAEGCIAIHKRPAGTKAYSKFTKADGTERDYVRKTDSYQPKVEITNTSRAIMDRVVSIAGGNCDTKQEAGTHGRKQTIYRWTVTADKARDLLRELYPHLVGKQHEARLAYGCPSSGEGAADAHESLKALHRGDAATIDFAAPETMWEAGWFLRSEIIWSRLRPNPMPESVTDRPTKAHSTVFLLSKSPRYFYDADAIREPLQPSSIERGKYGHSSFGKSQFIGSPTDERHQNGKTLESVADLMNPAGANARSVWTIPTEPTPFAHFATWPRKLVSRMILAGTSERGCCPECGAPWVRQTDVDREGRGTPSITTLGWWPSCRCGDWLPSGEYYRVPQPVPCTVLDPFAGSGTTCLVARNHGRHAIGIELNEAYLKIAAGRLAQLSLLAEGAA